MHIIQCDKCKKHSGPRDETGSPDDWRRITFAMGYPHGQKSYDLCPDCCKLMNIPVGNAVDSNLADRLLDIISELAGEAVADSIANS